MNCVGEGFCPLPRARPPAAAVGDGLQDVPWYRLRTVINARPYGITPAGPSGTPVPTLRPTSDPAPQHAPLPPPRLASLRPDSSKIYAYLGELT